MIPAPKISPRLSSHLYIRVDDDLRADLCSAAEREGLRMYDLVRLKLRNAVAAPDDASARLRPDGAV